MAVKMEATPLALRLRAETRVAHAAIDRHPILRPLISGGLTLDHYLRALASLHALYKQLEPTVAQYAWAASNPFRYHCRCDSLEADLAALNQEPCRDFGGFGCLVPNSPSEAAGILYVLEGSRLGGRVINESLEKMGLAVPMSFFSQSDNSPADSWRAFQGLLADESQAFNPDQVVAKACCVFEALRVHLNGCLEACASLA